MKNLKSPEIDKWRMDEDALRRLWGEYDHQIGGAFLIPSPNSTLDLVVVASNGDGWDHVSVSTKVRCPTWTEMDWIKRLFFDKDEVVMQLHVASADHISLHDYTLHLWRPHEGAIPLPPKAMVA